MKDVKKELPKGWRWGRLKNEITNNISLFKKDVFAEDTFKYIDISSIDNVTKRIIGYQEIPVNDAPSRAKYILGENDIIVATVRPNLNAVAIVDQQYAECIGSSGFCVVRLRNGHYPQYFFRYLTSPYFVDVVSAMVQGAMYPAINNHDVLNFEIPLPPTLDDQIAIANKLERKMAEVEAMRQAALRQKEASEAMEGAILKKVIPNGKELKIPSAWRREKLKSFSKIITGNTPPRSEPRYYRGHLPWIKPENLDKSNYVSKSIEYLTDEGKEKARILPSGAILVSCIGNIGKMAIAETELATNQQINSLILEKDYDIEYVYYALKLMMQEKIKNANQALVPILNATDFGKVEIPLPATKNEQQIIATGIKQKLSEAEKIQKATIIQLEAIEVMPGAILREVFDFGKN